MDKSRLIRIIIGSVIIIAGLIMQESWWIIGILPLMTGIINRCPSFLPGQSSCKIEPPKENKTENSQK